jgi:hypothetical protein
MSDTTATPIRAVDFRRWEQAHGEDFFDQYFIANSAFLLGYVLSRGSEHYDAIMAGFTDNGESNTLEEIAGARSNMFADGHDEAETELLNAIAAMCNASAVHAKRVRDAFASSGYTQLDADTEGEDEA